MKSRSIIASLTIVFSLTNSNTCYAQPQSETSKRLLKGNNISNVQFDTSKTAIIPFDPKGRYPFNKSYTPAILTQSDIYAIDSLLIICVTDYNNSLDKGHKQFSIDLNKYDYRKQLVVVTNEKGEKEVWVNCFCEYWDRWKSAILLADDGGNCYFNFKINLTTKQYYELGVNGYA